MQLDCFISITQNLSYDGRLDLPDSLKALFRPCAMMQPDSIVIGEVFLYSAGFRAARPLAEKLVAALRRFQEQLSPQSHYDFGLRSLKVIVIESAKLR